MSDDGTQKRIVKRKGDGAQKRRWDPEKDVFMGPGQEKRWKQNSGNKETPILLEKTAKRSKEEPARKRRRSNESSLKLSRDSSRTRQQQEGPRK